MDRLTAIFRGKGYDLNWIHLVASEEANEKRFRSRGGTKPQNLQRGIEMNTTIAGTTGFFTVETTALSPDEVAAIILDHIQENTQQGNPADS